MTSISDQSKTSLRPKLRRFYNFFVSSGGSIYKRVRCFNQNRHHHILISLSKFITTSANFEINAIIKIATWWGSGVFVTFLYCYISRHSGNRPLNFQNLVEKVKPSWYKLVLLKIFLSTKIKFCSSSPLNKKVLIVQCTTLCLYCPYK